MINRMSILATSALLIEDNKRFKIVKKEEEPKVEPISKTDESDRTRENPYANQNYIYYKDLHKSCYQEVGSHFDKKI